jgi:hypothetical protein
MTLTAPLADDWRGSYRGKTGHASEWWARRFLTHFDIWVR